ncbi:MAG: hypothetical protein M0R51_08555 [Clostridia bacterium]|jgi:hypothetical protein|nr:hypothetical protein [Clostridia bacterium]
MIFYDFEVFKHDWLVVTIDPITSIKKVIVNDATELREFYEQNKNTIWVGFNSRSYDSYILKGILIGLKPYEITKFIIELGRKGWEYSREFNKISLINYDVYLGEIDNSLKTLEAFMGVSIHESSIPFDIDRKLTPEEIIETIKYCESDVVNLIRVFNQRKDIFVSYSNLIKHYHLPPSSFGKTRPQLASIVLNAERLKPAPLDEFKYVLPDCLQLGKYEYIREWFLNPVNHDYKKSLTVEIGNITHNIGFGGLHDCREKVNETGLLLSVDVASYYPNLIRQYNLMSRAVKKVSLYNEIINERVGLKKTNKPLADSLKIILNSTYGAFKDKYNPMFDKRSANSVAISGQLLLIDLIEKVEPYCEILNSNTDGILVKCETEGDIAKVKEVSNEWEKRSGMVLEYDEYNKFISRDVNSYVLVDDKGHAKCKGAVKDLNALDYNLAIVNKALRAYLIDGVTPEEYIMSENNLIDYMMVCKLKGDFKQIVHEENGNQVIYPNRVVRVFASTNRGDGKIGRVKETNTNQSTLDSFFYDEISCSVGTMYKFANTPLNCYIDNGDIRNVKCDSRLDKQWYIDHVWDKLHTEWSK